VSADGAKHTVKLLIDGATTSCSASKGITFSGGVIADANVAWELHAPGHVRIEGTATMAGTQLEAGCLTTSAKVTL